MSRLRPKTIILPQDSAKQKTLEKYAERLISKLPLKDDRTVVRSVIDMAVAIEALLLMQLLEEGAMVNTDTFLTEMSEQNQALYDLLQDNLWAYDVVCLDLVKKIAKIQIGHNS